MNYYRVVINGRIYEGWSGTPANAVFGALRKDEPERPNNPGRRNAPPEDTDLEIRCEWLDQDPSKHNAKMKRMRP